VIKKFLPLIFTLVLLLGIMCCTNHIETASDELYDYSQGEDTYATLSLNEEEPEDPVERFYLYTPTGQPGTDFSPEELEYLRVQAEFLTDHLRGSLLRRNLDLDEMDYLLPSETNTFVLLLGAMSDPRRSSTGNLEQLGFIYSLRKYMNPF